MKPFRILTLVAALSAPLTAHAQDAAAVGIELNKADTIGESCRLTFVLKNSHEEQVEKMVAETVLFSDKNEVILLTLFDFGELPSGRPRVRQFQVPETSCDRLGMVLINGVDACTVGGAASDVCATSLTLSNRTKIGFDG